jgi:uncharacterized protein YhfF
MGENADVAACWTAYLRSLPEGEVTPPEYFAAGPFGADGEDELADKLAELVVRGVKTATSGFLRWYEETGRRHVQVGDLSIVTTSTGAPRCVIETTEVRILPFGEVDAAFALDYGEGDRTLPWWREHLGAYYARESAARQWEWSDATALVCHRFRVVFRCPEACGAS